MKNSTTMWHITEELSYYHKNTATNLSLYDLEQMQSLASKDPGMCDLLKQAYLYYQLKKNHAE
jgi:hypothetical protein